MKLLFFSVFNSIFYVDTERKWH